MRPLLLFAHGAGLPSSAPWMVAWAERLRSLGRVHTFDYPYMQRGSKRPDRAPVLIAAHVEALNTARAGHSGPIALIGKSMGGRMGCHVALTEPVDALICLGYPLAGGGKRDKLRDQVLLDLRVPVLFVQGTRDRLCPLDLLADVRGRMTARSALHIVETGDHSLQITKTHTKRTGVTQEDADGAALAAIKAFLAEG